ncbi:mechanosensitive ion channel family protein [Mesoflavibacter sp. SCSIO 43206]|uniref:mechanosensitive ion channel family protein n=1 Tax=Mesoflavibacter sp. SCSIO 43206 TaxID=2779362 RepID=UPI001CA9DA91|nr:mechanosensitive ion channel domain-containing protein [Mesoflavibacter sp. SCSIO 43206]UAB75124.1 mechanosensitive ion channel [Mesoflavibacter sp. SCSIO 43206]
MNKYQHFFYDYFKELSFTDTSAKYMNMLLLFVIALVGIFIVDLIVRTILRFISARIASTTKSNFDDLLISNRVPANTAHVPALYLVHESIPIVFHDFENLHIILEKITTIIAIILGLWIVRSLLNTLKSYFKTLPRLKDKPIDSYIQVFMIFAWSAGILLAIAVVIELSLTKFIAGFGTISAIILLIFKDTILGFVASIQVAINDMVRIGDWITFEKYGADGDVIEINLATVKVQNWDNTITTIPTYAMISDSFKNWRGMTNSDGRRIKRHMLIKQNSIKYLTDEDIERLKGIQIIESYLTNMQQKIEQYNTANNADKSLLINGRNLTNVGVFRKFIQTYLEQHSAINDQMLLMARQLQPTAEGIPIEIYCFSKDKRWQNYEYVMSDLFDHFLAAVPYFDLEIFEFPDNSTFKSLSNKGKVNL